MKKRKLNYIFHNPNTVAVTADYLLDILIEANMEKVERMIQSTVDYLGTQTENTEEYLV